MRGHTPRRSRIAHFKAPFIVSVVAPAALGLACGGKSHDDGIFHPQNPPEVGGSSGTYDPLAKPSPTATGGAGGTTSTQQCSAERPAPDPSCHKEYRCENGEWQWVPTSCNPLGLPPVCPDSMPAAGSDCAADDQVCLYPVCEPDPSSATCHYGQWVVVYSPGAACNPPAVVTPVCPQQPIVEGANCWYDEQLCSQDDTCTNGLRDAFQCVGGHWQGEVIGCPSSEAPDGGAEAPDGGVATTDAGS